eukprot:TRINITY_DN13215_c0_g1_i2.p1 TRINITY_DN13215_c0_g1~~TRINITY_DN13215_c0_g1_i2.p1  ORF type:complete len:127 (+),score=18.89 TRINITY_DN13215_c0_g1_i2:139-519(+)
MYSAPELFNEDELYQTPADVFALAVLMHELLSGKEPYAGMNIIAMIKNIAAGQHPDEKLLDNHPATAAIGQWLVECWATDTGQRPSSKTLATQLLRILAEFTPQSGNAGHCRPSSPSSTPRTCSWP